jgi:ribonuclease D
MTQVSDVDTFDLDVSTPFARLARSAGTLAVDIETSGLEWKYDQIATIQIHVDEGPTAITRIGDEPPTQVARLIADPGVRKVFHHAMFDARFLAHHWGVTPANIACTKIAAKLLDRGADRQNSLQALLRRYLGVTIDKGERTSDWLSPSLTQEQMDYAAADVAYLLDLMRVLENELRQRELISLANACFAHIPARVQLDIAEYEDVFTY